MQRAFVGSAFSSLVQILPIPAAFPRTHTQVSCQAVGLQGHSRNGHGRRILPLTLLARGNNETRPNCSQFSSCWQISADNAPLPCTPEWLLPAQPSRNRCIREKLLRYCLTASFLPFLISCFHQECFGTREKAGTVPMGDRNTYLLKNRVWP